MVAPQAPTAAGLKTGLQAGPEAGPVTGPQAAPPDATAPLRAGLMLAVIGATVALVFVDAAWLTLAASACLCLYLALGLRQFSLATWVPVSIALVSLGAALATGLAPEVLLKAADRMLFLASLLALLNSLRVAALMAPEVARAGDFLTGQPAARRYVTLSLGSHLFGLLVNFGALGLLLDLVRRSMRDPRSLALPEDLRAVKERRMVLAVLRGFGLIALWSPLGFVANTVLITLPGLRYLDFAPIGMAMVAVFTALGWLIDRHDGRRYRAAAGRAPGPPAGAWTGALALVGHVIGIGVAVLGAQAALGLSFQSVLLIVVPAYALIWAAWTSARAGTGAASGLRRAATTYAGRLPNMVSELGVFAAAGFIPVVLLALIPLDGLQAAVAQLGLGALALSVLISVSVLVCAFIGINPIVGVSMIGAVAAQLAVPGLSAQVIALSLIGGWVAVICFSPFMTTIIVTAATIGQRPATIGIRWNGLFSVASLAVWIAMMAGLMGLGLI